MAGITGDRGARARASTLLATMALGTLTWLVGASPAAAADVGEPIHIAHPDGPSGRAVDVNDSGQVVGVGIDRFGRSHAFSWTEETGTIDLTPSLAADSSQAVDVNDAGYVVGTMGAGATTRAFIWDAVGGLREIPSPVDAYTVPVGIDERGLVTGNSTTYDPEANVFERSIWSWSPTTGYEEIIGGIDVEITAADDGFAAGYWRPVGAPTTSVFRWSPAEGFRDLGLPAGIDSAYAKDVNDAGEVVLDTDVGRVYAWTPADEFVELDTLGTPSFIWGLNDLGVAVGVSYDPTLGPRAFAAEAGGDAVAIDDGADGYSQAVDVNDAGTVVGFYYPVGSSLSRPFTWTEAGGREDLSLGSRTHGDPSAIAEGGGISGVGYTIDGGGVTRNQAVYWPPVVPATATVGQAAVHQLIEVDVAGYASGSATRVSGRGVTVHSTTALTPTGLLLDVSVTATAAIGPRDLTIGTTTALCTACVIVTPRPVVTTASPATIPEGATRTLTITGSGFQPGATAAFFRQGVADPTTTVTAVDVISPAELRIEFSVTSPTGARTVEITNVDGGRSTRTAAFTVNLNPVVTSTLPVHLHAGTTATVRVNGSAFHAGFVEDGGTVDFGGGADVLSIVRRNGSRLDVEVAVAPDAAAGPRTVTVTNPNGGTGSCSTCIDVVVDPVVSGITPPARTRGTTAQPVVIDGTGFQPGATVAFSPAGGITVGSTTVTGSATIELTVSITTGASLASRTVVVTNPDGGVASCTGCFDVLARPTVTAYGPVSQARGTTIPAGVDGTNLQQGAVVTFSGTGVTAVVLGTTGTQLLLEVTVEAGAATGYRTVTVTNPDGSTAQLTRAVRIT